MREFVRRSAVPVMAAMSLTALGACANSSSPEPDRIVVSESVVRYDTLDELRADSDIVVMGRIGEVVVAFRDFGGNNPVHPDGDEAFYLDRLVFRLDVETTSAAARNGEMFVITDEAADVGDDLTPRFEQGQPVVLFLVEASGPGWSPEFFENTEGLGGTVYAVMGGNQGVFDVQGDLGESRADPGLGEIPLNILLAPLGDG